MSRFLAFFDRHEVVLTVALYTGLVYYVLDRFLPFVGEVIFSLLCTVCLVALLITSVKQRRARARARRATLANLQRGTADVVQS